MMGQQLAANCVGYPNELAMQRAQGQADLHAGWGRSPLEGLQGIQHFIGAGLGSIAANVFGGGGR
jgi:hypothetical protein